MQQAKPEAVSLPMPVEDFPNAGHDIAVLLAEGADASEGGFRCIFQADEAEPIVASFETDACRNQSSGCARHRTQRDQLRVRVRLLDENFIIPDREVVVEKSDTEPLVNPRSHKVLPKLVQACAISCPSVAIASSRSGSSG